MEKFYARGNNLSLTGREAASIVVTAVCSVTQQHTRMNEFGSFSAVLVRTTANLVSAGVVYVTFVMRVSLH